MRFVIVTGMSGSGKRTTMKMLEDIGFYCVDNLPVSLIDKFTELMTQPGSEYSKVALGVDVRTGGAVKELPSIVERLRETGNQAEMLFLEATDAVLIRRYKETRRTHPLSPSGRVEEGILKEREMLVDVRSKADYVFDTSNLLTRELKEEIDRIFVQNGEYESLQITIVSFGFKHGIPTDADLVFDVRFLPNPFYIDELKNLTGLDREVQEYVMQFPEAGEFLDKTEDMLRFLIPNYIKEGKYSLVVAVGCTGGKHRSVTLASGLYQRLRKNANYGIRLHHRDVSKAGT